jgi:Carboxypeptidase regulatory-like domain
MNWKRFMAVMFALLVSISVGASRVSAQASISTGNIQGTITDAQGAIVPAAKVTIINNGNGLKITPPVNGAGIFNSGPVEPGSYSIHVEASGFKTTDVGVIVQVGNIASEAIVLQVGSGSTTVTVEATTETVNPDQVTIQGVLTPEQIENLPINGRNFLDLAQLEPGVQIQDGGNFDPTKKGFESVSFGGRFGRTARIEVDGLDISDETVGTTTQNISMNSIQEFQVAQSSLDLGTELTSSGTINVTTKSGTNNVHGEGFYGYRDNGSSANIGTAPNESIFTRKQYGVDIGAPIIKDKLFAFGSWERTTQTENAAVQPVAPFQDLNGTVGSPFNDLEFLGRVDFNVTKNVHAFFKFTYEQNKDVASFVPGTYEPFANVDNTPSYGGGLDFTTGSFTHSIRIGYLKFRNGIAASPVNDPVLNPTPLLSLAIGNVSTACTVSGNLFCAGLNILAPQATFQSDKQFKYSGSKVLNTHTLVYGAGVNRILGGGFASFFGLGPAVRSAFNPANVAFAAADPFGPGGSSNPANYPVTRIDVGNGQGAFTEIPQFGLPAGGQFDTRFQAYVGDTWKLKPNLTFIYGMRYNRDTGRTDSDLPAIPALNEFQAGLGNPVSQPNHNFGGNLGLAWSPGSSSKTVIRAGIGLNYENGIFNNVLFDRPGRLPAGLFNQVQEVCTQGGVTYPDGSFVSTVDGLDIPTQVCGNAVGNVQQAIADIQTQYQAATLAAGPQANGAYFGASNTTANTGSMFAPNFRSPYAINMNVGFQRELRPGTVLSVDYLRNVGLHTLLGIDKNHQGDAGFLDVPTAQAAISETNSQFGCGTGFDAASINCAIAAGATIGSYSASSAAHPVSLAGGLNVTGGFPVGPGAAAFGGVNPNFGSVLLLYPGGRSNYNALQVVLRSDVRSPVRFIHRLNTQVSYSFSRFNAQATDGDFVNSALDYNNPGKYIGPNSLDRTHQLSAGIVMELPKGFRMDFITHWATALPQTLTFNAAGNPEDIFQIDTTGDGQTGVAPIPGTNVGSFGRSIKADGLNNALTKYSSAFGNQLTPAGNALVAAGLFSSAQLQSLCAVTPSLNPSAGCAAAYPNLQIPLAPAGQVGNGALFTFDMTLGYSFRPIRRWESFRIEPQVRFFNLFNHPIYNLPDNLLSGVLDGSEGSVDGTTKAQRRVDSVGLAGLGSGTFAQGAARVIEFGGKISF